MIHSFGDAATEDVFHGTNSKAARKIPKDLWSAARRKLDLVNAATSVKASRVPPGNRLEALQGERAGSFSICVNDQDPNHVPVRRRTCARRHVRGLPLRGR